MSIDTGLKIGIKEDHTNNSFNQMAGDLENQNETQKLIQNIRESIDKIL